MKDNLKKWMTVYYESLKRELMTFGYPDDTVTFEGLLEDFDGLKYQGLIKGILHTYVMPIKGHFCHSLRDESF